MYYFANKLKNRILFANLVHFFSFPPFCMLFWCLFWQFLTPLYAHMGAQGLHMDPNPEFDELSRQTTKEHILSANLVLFFSFSPFPCFLGNFFGDFWPPSMPIWGLKVSVWTLTPNFIIWAWNQPENGACLSILWCFFHFIPCVGFLSENAP